MAGEGSKGGERLTDAIAEASALYRGPNPILKIAQALVRARAAENTHGAD